MQQYLSKMSLLRLTQRSNDLRCSMHFVQRDILHGIEQANTLQAQTFWKFKHTHFYVICLLLFYLYSNDVCIVMNNERNSSVVTVENKIAMYFLSIYLFWMKILDLIQIIRPCCLNNFIYWI